MDARHIMQQMMLILIVKTAVECAMTTPSIAVGDDTDLLVLLVHHTRAESLNILFKPKPKHNVKKKMRIWDIKLVQETLGTHVCQNILVAHAILGFDTTSHLFGLSKHLALKRMVDNPHFGVQAKIFSQECASQDVIAHAGEEALVCLYGGKQREKLDSMRYDHYCEKVISSTTCVSASTLPPTSAASKYHSFHVYHQVQQWQNTADQLDPKAWGWQVVDRRLVPIQTDKEPAPLALLEVVRCNCKTGCCTMQCGCRKHGLDCSSGCGECKGACTNSSQPPEFEDNDDCHFVNQEEIC